jgi:hypothetical protein
VERKSIGLLPAYGKALKPVAVVVETNRCRQRRTSCDVLARSSLHADKITGNRHVELT